MSNGQWFATTGVTSVQLYRKTGKADIATLYDNIAVRIYGKTGGVVLHSDKILAVAQWLKSGKRASLILMGDTGTGKSTLAGALAEVIGIENPYPYTYTMQSLEKICLERGWWEEIQKEKRYLVLDDMGSEAREVNDYGTRRIILNELISTRYDLKLPVIITTNLNTATIREQYGEKTASRLNEMCDTLLMAGEDLRYDTDNH